VEQKRKACDSGRILAVGTLERRGKSCQQDRQEKSTRGRGQNKTLHERKEKLKDPDSLDPAIESDSKSAASRGNDGVGSGTIGEKKRISCPLEKKKNEIKKNDERRDCRCS